IYLNRDLAVIKLFTDGHYGRMKYIYGDDYLSALHVNGDGTPSHPLYLPYSYKLEPYIGRKVGQ
ncbi:MAG: hypothetical protein WAU69_11020, partial [Solirubrobacteraceae bacterium]